jgi:F420-non-reducing hydrogenase iron-sulfur subunit
MTKRSKKKAEIDEYEPRIVAFACNWCSYAGADLAGISRLQYPPNIRMIRVMCSGRVSPSFILRAFDRGADGVLVSGCHIGDCHYGFGNRIAEKNVAMTKRLMELLGLEADRLRLEWISASEGEKFAASVGEFTERIKQLGRSPISASG